MQLNETINPSIYGKIKRTQKNHREIDREETNEDNKSYRACSMKIHSGQTNKVQSLGIS